MVLDESGNLYCGGDFTTVDGITANRVAMWDGTTWTPLGDGLNNKVHSLAYVDGNLYAGGQFTQADGESAINIAMWDGFEWSALGTGPNGTVYALAAQGDDLYAGGSFSIVDSVAAANIARWDGEDWSAVGSGTTGRVNALTSDGSTLTAGGNFTIASVGASNIAQWNGTEWTTLGTGVNGQVFALHHGETDLYAGGEFTQAGGLSDGNKVAKWDGTNWSALGTGMPYNVYAITSNDEDVFVGTIKSAFTKSVNQWDGSAWTTLGSATNSTVRALTNQGLNLYVGGDFTTAGGIDSTYAALAITSFEPNIEIRDPNDVRVTNGSTTDFTDVGIGSTDAKITYTVYNRGNLLLDIQGLTISGTDIDSFVVDSSELIALLPPEDSTTFSVTFTPTDDTERTFNISIASDDPDSNPFVMNFSGTGVSPQQLLEEAIADAGLEDDDAGFEATPFNDGVENILKYGFNMDLTGPDVTTLAADGDTGLPRYSVIEDDGDHFFRFEFLRRKGSGLIYTPLKSPDLDTEFVESTGTETVEDIDTEWERVFVDEPVDLTTNPTCFGRVMVELPTEEEDP
ncbi:choice-of-anchor D domain-containing protein [Haloferula sp.]|uniref:choice-of-anchor D domain-containing protein n=1 Tax=Haloferula sp. TaxID=2497595 RepID=UPI00329D1B56